MKKHLKTVCVILCTLMCLSLILSPLSFSQEHSHDCTGEDCRICQIISVAKLLIGSFMSVLAISFGNVILRSRCVISTFIKGYGDITPIKQKVKLTI